MLSVLCRLYDMEQGQVSCEIAERVRRLFGQAWRAHEALRALELAMDEEGDITGLNGTEESGAHEEEEGLVIRMMQLHHRIDNIQKELERLQNPLIRSVHFLITNIFPVVIPKKLLLHL